MSQDNVKHRPNPEKSLLTTKLVPQRTRGQLIPRPRLMEKLAQLTPLPKLSLLVAPAGFGKSTLLAQLIEHINPLRNATAWLSLDQAEDNLDSFSAYLCASFRHAVKQRSEGTEIEQGIGLANTTAKARLSWLIEEIAALPYAVQLVLDDFHVISNHKVLALIEWFIKRMPANAALIIASRKQPDLSSFIELKSQGELLEINARELSFTLEETQAYLALSKGICLDDKTLHALYQRTEGWVAATQLASYALTENENKSEFVAQFSGTDKDIVNYLGEYVLDNLPRNTQQFLLDTSILKRLNTALCENITNMPTAGAILASISQRGMFLFELDRQRYWFRYHHLFRDFLLAKLRSSDPGKLRKLGLRAARWSQAHGYPHEAIDYYLSAEEYHTAAHLIAEQVLGMVQYHGQHEVLLQWAEALPEEYLLGEPRMAIGYAWSLVFTRNLKDVVPYLTALKQRSSANDETTRNKDDLWLTCSVSMLESFYNLMAGNIALARTQMADWLQVWPKAPAFERGSVMTALSSTCLQTLEFNYARCLLADAKKRLHTSGSHYGVAWTESFYGVVHIKQGHMLEARQLLSSALTESNEYLGEQSFGSAVIRLALGLAYYETADFGKAKACIDASVSSIDEHGVIEQVHIAFLTRSRLLLHEGAHEEGMAVLLEAESFGQRLGLAGFDMTILAERVRQLILQSKVEAAKALVDERGVPTSEQEMNDYTPSEQLQIDLMLARIALAEGLAEEALLRLKAMNNLCTKKGFLQMQASVYALEAAAFAQLDKKNQALRKLTHLISMTQQHQHLSVFHDERIYMTTLLPKLLERISSASAQLDNAPMTIAPAFFNRLADIFNLPPTSSEPKQSPEEAVDKKVGQLSKRELELLKYLEQGMSNKELSETLFISLATTKWHLSHIYTKLGVKNRLEAIKAYQKLL